jgi:hypothetical protein
VPCRAAGAARHGNELAVRTGADDPFFVQPNVLAAALGGFGVDADALTPLEIDERGSSNRLAAMYDALMMAGALATACRQTDRRQRTCSATTR